MAKRGSNSTSDVTLLATGKSQSEVAALRHLREAYDALGVANTSTKGDSSPKRTGPETPDMNGRPRSSTSRVVNTLRSLQLSQSAPQQDDSRVLFAHWLTLESLARAIDVDAAAIHREIQTCDVKTSEIVQFPIELADIGEPKLQVLREVLGEDVFANYISDLFREVAGFRRRCSLYGDVLRLFVDRVKMQCIGSHIVRDVLSHNEWLEIANAALSSIHNDGSSPVLVSHFPLLMRHCRNVKEDDSGVVISEIIKLLGRLPPARTRLVSLCFEQIGDVRRGSGTAPPPDGVRHHKLSGLAKQSHADALCSREELDEILNWLNVSQENGETSITMDAFLSFHVAISDSFVNEDAEFATYLMRVWKYELIHDLEIDNVIANYEARCQQLTNKARKVEVWKKLDHLRAAFPAKLAALRLDLTQVSSIAVTTAVQFKALEMQHDILASTLAGLRVLRLTGLCLVKFPRFVEVLPQLEVLDLSDNELHEPLPMEIICNIKTLKHLQLNNNRLNDRSFILSSVGADAVAKYALDAMETVELAKNELTIIPSLILQCKSLRQLNIAGNKLRGCGVTSDGLKLWTSRRFPKLQMIDVRENELSTLPAALFEAGQASLEAIYAQDNDLQDLPASFITLTQLREAVLSRNSLKLVNNGGISELLATCTKWKELILDHNALKAFPLQVPSAELHIQGLVAIRLAKNRIRALPSLQNVVLAACEELDLQGNALVDIAEGFFPAFPALRIALFQHNNLKCLPDSIESCQHLHTLEIYENRLEYVPPQLASLKELTVLNLRDNQLTTIPTEWHAFASYFQHGHHLRLRVLQSLYLQRNPLKNRVLQTLVDGTLTVSRSNNEMSRRPTSATPFKSSATQICEMYVRKFIDTLKQSVPVQSLARAVHVEELDDEDATDEDEEKGRRRTRKWKGRARFVIQHVEAQLKSRCDNSDEGRARLLLTTTAFKKLLQKLLVASTQKELQLMSERFQDGVGVVDGLGFLCGVETVGLFDALRPLDTDARKREAVVQRCESVRKPIDAVSSILQYLQVAHEQRLRVGDAVTEPLSSSSTHRSGTAGHVQVTAAVAKRRRPQSAKTPRGPVATTDPNPFNQRSHRDATLQEADVNGELRRHEAEAERQRQRQRIRVLEQQLLDQQLLRLAEHATPISAGDSKATDVALSAANTSLTVHVKQLNSDRRKAPDKAELLVVSIAPDASVLQLKQAINARIQVGVDRQILVAKNPSCQREHVRLRDDAPLHSYCPPGSLGSRRWQVSLMISDELRIDWAKVRVGTRPPAFAEAGQATNTET